MRQKSAAIMFVISICLLVSGSVFFALSDPNPNQNKWKNQTMLRMSVPYERTDLLVASTVSLGNLTDGQRKLLRDCAQKTEEFQAEALIRAQEELEMTLKDRRISTEIFSVREQEVE